MVRGVTGGGDEDQSQGLLLAAPTRRNVHLFASLVTTAEDICLESHFLHLISVCSVGMFRIICCIDKMHWYDINRLI